MDQRRRLRMALDVVCNSTAIVFPFNLLVVYSVANTDIYVLLTGQGRQLSSLYEPSNCSLGPKISKFVG